MRLPVLACLCLSLGACAEPAPPASTAPPATVTPAPSTTTPASPATMSPVSPTASMPGGPPSFDCAAATDEDEKMVCADPALSALDRQLAAVYADAIASSGADTKTLAATQQGWIRERHDCWKAEDKPRCLREAYLTRLVDLQINSGKVMVPTPVEFRCDDASKPFTVTYYNELDPKAAVITWGNDQAIAFPQPAASGARYGREGLEFWEHQGEAKVDFYGNALTCKPVG